MLMFTVSAEKANITSEKYFIFIFLQSEKFNAPGDLVVVSKGCVQKSTTLIKTTSKKTSGCVSSAAGFILLQCFTWDRC